MVAADYPFFDLIWSMAIFFLWVVWIWILIEVIADIFRRHDVSGWAKTAWLIFVILLPFLGVFVYLITQNVGMTERNLARARAKQDQFDAYVRERAAGSGEARPRRSRRRSSCSTAARSRRPSSRRSSRRRSPSVGRRTRVVGAVSGDTRRARSRAHIREGSGSTSRRSHGSPDPRGARSR